MREIHVFAMEGCLPSENRLSPAFCDDENHSDLCEESSPEDAEIDVFGGLAALPVEVCERRPTCLRCGYVIMMRISFTRWIMSGFPFVFPH